MSLVFNVESGRNKAQRVWLKLPSALAHHLLSALAYELRGQVLFRELRPDDLLARIASVHRQFALGRSREFTGAGVDEPRLLGELAELAKVAERVRDGSSIVLLGKN